MDQHYLTTALPIHYHAPVYILVEHIPENFPSDRELVMIAHRTLRALAPDGWRGGADEPRMPAPAPGGT